MPPKCSAGLDRRAPATCQSYKSESEDGCSPFANKNGEPVSLKGNQSGNTIMDADFVREKQKRRCFFSVVWLLVLIFLAWPLGTCEPASFLLTIKTRYYRLQTHQLCQSLRPSKHTPSRAFTFFSSHLKQSTQFRLLSKKSIHFWKSK